MTEADRHDVLRLAHPAGAGTVASQLAAALLQRVPDWDLDVDTAGLSWAANDPDSDSRRGVYIVVSDSGTGPDGQLRVWSVEASGYLGEVCVRVELPNPADPEDVRAALAAFTAFGILPSSPPPATRRSRGCVCDHNLSGVVGIVPPPQPGDR